MAHNGKAGCNIVEYNGAPVFLLAVYSMTCYNYFHVFLSFLLSLLSILCGPGFWCGEREEEGGGGSSVDFGCVLLIRP